jgi:hypothetical protein
MLIRLGCVSFRFAMPKLEEEITLHERQRLATAESPRDC